MVYFLYYIIPAIFTLYAIRKLRERSWGYCTNNVRLDKKVAIVTGANSGIGFEVARELVRRGAKVILACRDFESAACALDRIKAEFGYDIEVIPMKIDLGSLASIKEFVKELRLTYPKVDILINNAGVAYRKNQLVHTKDKFEAHFGINYLGHFYLTNLLLANFPQSSRIINVSSFLHKKGEINFDPYNPQGNRYANSKLANIYFSHELARKVQDKDIQVFAVCPGWVYTNLFRHSLKWYHYILVAPIAFFFMRSAKQGAQSIIYCATEPNLQTGSIIRDCKYFKSTHRFENKIAKQLWSHSENLIEDIVDDGMYE